MNTILEQILNHLNTGIGFVGSIVTIYDHFKHQDDTHVTEVFTAIRSKSKETYDLYCEYRRYRKNDIGTPSEEAILGYWKSCYKRETLPCVSDMIALNIADKEEAEIMLAYLFEAWMEIPDFVAWLHDLLARNKLDELSEALISMQKNINGISKLTNELKQQSISNIAFTLSPKRIVDAKYSCTDLDVKHYYMVDNRFTTMLKVISAAQDIPNAEAIQKVMDLAEQCHPVIIAGNGGLGKTSMMLRAAVQWVSYGRVAVWLSLSDKDVITEQKAAALYNNLTAAIPVGQRILLCIDNPYEGKVSFSNLQKMWPNDDRIQLIMAERANRLTLLADPDQDYLLYWFDDAQMIILQGLKQSSPEFCLKDFVSCQFSETQERRKKILEKCTLFLVKEEIIKEEDRINTIQTILRKYGKPTVSLVELIYRTLFELKKRASKPEYIILDWEEWGNFIESEFGKGDAFTRKELYGVIAALKIFNTPITLSLFCKYFEIKERKLKNYLMEELISHHSEPVIYRNETLEPKHDVIAELFFLFHEKTVSINSLMLNLLQCMDENEIEAFLIRIVNKGEFRKGWKYHVGQIQYRDYMNKIYDRIIDHSCNLSETGKAYLCLGYLWSESHGKKYTDGTSLNDILTEIAPETDGTLILAKLYTEWGIWAAVTGNNTLAEEKYRIVIDNYPEQLPARTELGLLSKQKGREKEAEKILREAMRINPKHIQSRTELGRLLSKQKGREKEAERLFKEVIKINAFDIMSRTELGKLLSRQNGREKEAEKILREAMQIEPRHIQSRTELGKLLLNQKGREEEAEKVLCEVIEIRPTDVYARCLLARLYEKCNRQTEAVKLYQEVCKYEPNNLYGQKGLERLKKYVQ